MVILDLWCISFHAVVVFVLGKDLLFKSVLGHRVVPNQGQKYALDFEKRKLQFQSFSIKLKPQKCRHSNTL